MEIARIAVRGHETGSLDAEDVSEQRKTRYILDAPPLEIGAACLQAFRRSPARFLGVLAAAFRLGLKCDGGVFKHLAYFVEACVLRSWLSRDAIEHVHAHFGTNVATVAMLCRSLGGPTYSFTVHGPEEFDRPQRLALREKIQGAKFVAAISSFCRSQIYRWARFSDWDKVQIVRCALDASYFEGSSTVITSKPKLVCVGRLSEEKGQMLVVRAASLLQKRGVAVDLVLAGDGPLRPQIERESSGWDCRASFTSPAGSTTRRCGRCSLTLERSSWPASPRGFRS